MKARVTKQGNHAERISEVTRIFDDKGFGNAELLEGWDGADLEELRELLSDEEFQTLLDEMEDLHDRTP